MRIDITVENKIAINNDPNARIVCGNSDYEINFMFDAEWDSHDVKTAIFVSNGKCSRQVFTGNVCPVPVLQNTQIVWVGVFAGTIDDGTLSTSTPAIVQCTPCITDGDNVPAPPQDDVYNQIIKLLEEIRNGGGGGEGAKEIVTVDIDTMLDNNNTALFLSLSERYIKGEISLVASLDGSAAIVSAVQRDDDNILWTAFTAYPSQWGYISIVVYNIVYNSDGETATLEYSANETKNYELPDLSLQGNMDTLVGMKYFPETNTAKYVAVYLKDELANLDLTDDEKTEICDGIGAANKLYVDSNFVAKTATLGNRVYVSQSQSNGTFLNSTVPYATGAQSATIALRGQYGTLAVGTPTDDAHATTKKYVDDKIGDIETVLDSIIAIQNTLIGGGTV